MSTHIETEAAIRELETWFSVSDQTRTVVAYWREHMQPAVPNIPDGCELVEVDGVPVFRLVTEADYGWLKPNGGIVLVGYFALPQPTDPFAGKRYIVHQVAPPVPTEVERLTQALAAYYWAKWGNGPGPDLAAYRVRAQDLYDLGMRCPEQTP